MRDAVADLPQPDMLRLEESWTYLVTVLADRVARRVGQTVQETAALNLSQWRVLAALADRPGRTAAEVVELTPMDKGVVSRAVATLVARGLVARAASPEDGRRSPLTLTEGGWEIYRDCAAALAANGADGRSGGSADLRAELKDALAAMVSAY
jgi:DNA-binding MarR family transcriptional regulator